MTITIKLPKKLVFALVAVALLAATAVAVAAWVVGGSGTGYAKAGTASAITLGDASASVSGDLYPGGSGAVKIKVTNPNPFAVRITGVSLSSGGSVTSSVGACNTGGTGVTFSNQSGLTLDMPASSGPTTFTLAGAVSMAASSDNACQGAVFSIPVDLTATSN
jgi:P pilus assembly chaperone PapD